jgi:tRNA(fMet)-specific endonuclease VapC
MILRDTDHLTVLTNRRHSSHLVLLSRLAGVTDPIYLPVISVEEQMRGWLARIRSAKSPHRLIGPYADFVDLIEGLEDWDILRWDDFAAANFVVLKKPFSTIGNQDLKIAAQAQSRNALLLTANEKHFGKIPNLRIENWLA